MKKAARPAILAVHELQRLRSCALGQRLGECHDQRGADQLFESLPPPRRLVPARGQGSCGRPLAGCRRLITNKSILRPELFIDKQVERAIDSEIQDPTSSTRSENP